ncbi:hypothetical protein NDU88_003382 [Pleurodeles waltl]|uniref:Uncharacterized protein n=1 Tax=Pleurodeles waltl TaxID=8319 RepID=A0AAV7SG98_PLEWA|nr:hypothetical protein NDU88_003382 [Pleurodeles waltl]
MIAAGAHLRKQLRPACSSRARSRMGGVATGRARPAPPLKTLLPGSAPPAGTAVPLFYSSSRLGHTLRASMHPIQRPPSTQVPKRERALVGRTYDDQPMLPQFQLRSFGVPEHFSTTIVPSERSSTGTAALEETSLTHTSHHDTSAVEGMTDQFWNKHTQIGGGVTAVLVLIVLSGIAMFMTWKKRNQRHTPKTITENSSIPMMSQAATKERVDSNLMEEQNTEHVEEGT